MNNELFELYVLAELRYKKHFNNLNAVSYTHLTLPTKA